MEAKIVNARGSYNYVWTLFRAPTNEFSADAVEEIEFAR